MQRRAGQRPAGSEPVMVLLEDQPLVSASEKTQNERPRAGAAKISILKRRYISEEHRFSTVGERQPNRHNVVPAGEEKRLSSPNLGDPAGHPSDVFHPARVHHVADPGSNQDSRDKRIAWRRRAS